MTRKARTVVAALVFSFALGSVPLVHAATGYSSNTGALQRLYFRSDGSIQVTLSGRPATAEDCGTNQYYTIAADHPQRDAFLSALLMSWTSRQIVSFRVADPHVSGTACQVSYMVLDR